jgi:ferredoxin
MTLTRKEFFRQAVLSLGKSALEVSDVLKGHSAAEAVPELADPPPPPPAADEPRLATVDNSHCLARSCGCFSCIERCQTEAITIVFGQGVAIDAGRCTGCGDCEYVCPTKAIVMTAKA